MGFEPTVAKMTTEVFKTSALDRYATSPWFFHVRRRRWDSNPREPIRLKGLANLRTGPLCDVSSRLPIIANHYVILILVMADTKLSSEHEQEIDLSSAQSTKKIEEKTLFEWRAPERPFKRRNRKFYTNIIGLAIIGSLFLFFFDGWAPVLLIIAIVFFIYVISTIEPEIVKHKITTAGLWFSNTFYPYEESGHFWFAPRLDSTILVLETYNFPHRMEFVILKDDQKKIEQLLSKYLLHEELPPSFLDRATQWFTSKLPQ